MISSIPTGRRSRGRTLLFTATLILLGTSLGFAAQPAAPATGVAGTSGAPATGSPPPEALGPVRVHDRTAFVYRVGRGALSPEVRGRRTSEVLRESIEEGLRGELVFELQDGEALFRLGDRLLFVLTAEDAAAEGEQSLERFAAERKQSLESFLKAERRRASLQHVTLSISLAVFLGFMSFLLVRRLRQWSLRALEWVDSSEHNARSGVRRFFADEKMRWVGLMLVHGLSFFAQAAVIYLFLLGSLSLFETTKPWREQLSSWAMAPLVAVAERISTSIPTLLLLFLLIVILQAGWHAINVTSERVAKGRLTLRGVPPELVPSVRLLARAGLILAALLVLAPLLTGQSASVFTRIGFWMLEALGLAMLPLIATVILGLYALLTRRYPRGARIELPGDLSGTVASVDLFCLRIQSERGPAMVPHLLLLVRPFRLVSATATLTVEVPVRAPIPPAWALARLETAAGEFARENRLSGPVTVSLEELGLEAARFQVSLGPAPSVLRSGLLLRLSSALSDPEPRPVREAGNA